jgi:RimJ/RimL family protein N-acetyltransferase
MPKREKEKFLAEFDKNLDLLRYAVESLDGRLAGRAPIDRSKIPGERTITIVLAKDFQGRGTGPAVAHYFIDCYFSDERVIAIRAEVHKDIAQSLHLLTSLEFEDISETNDWALDLPGQSDKIWLYAVSCGI